ncbi:hypothetical protein GCM10020220_014930 [Nonomuraea rubra]|uniref:hypothetical protein n=1 Tax=Nonomuraea rubra TaxID=46180 RepID=UPI0031EE2D04
MTDDPKATTLEDSTREDAAPPADAPEPEAEEAPLGRAGGQDSSPGGADAGATAGVRRRPQGRAVHAGP